MRFFAILSCILLIQHSSYGQTNWKVGFYDSVDDFLEQRPVDTCNFELRTFPDFTKSDSLDVPNLFKLIPIKASLSRSHFYNNSILAWNGKHLFLNMLMLRMSKGFVMVEKVQPHILFFGREPAPVDWGTNGTSGWVRQDTPPDMQVIKPYVFSLHSGRAHPLTSSTLERLLEPYPELLSLYTRDPNWKELETLKLYLDLLNEMLE